MEAGGAASPDDRAIVLSGLRRQRQVVVHCCELASAAGVRIGMDIAHARAIVPEERLAVYDDKPARDAAALDVLARWATRFSPRVATDAPDGLLMDLTGCERIHPDPARLMEQLHTLLARQGIAARMAIAPTVGCAWALARFGDDGAIIADLPDVRQALAGLPVRALRISPAIEAALQEVAIDRVGHLYALSRSQVAQRFGDELLWRLDLAWGQAFEAIDAVAHVEPVRVSRAFDGPVKDLEMIMLATRGLVDDLVTELVQREAGVTKLRLGMERVDTSPLRELVELSAPTRDARHLWTLLRPIVEQAHLGFGVDEVELWARKVSGVTHAQASCWSSDDALTARAMEQAMGRLIDRFSQRFGAERVSRVAAKQSYVPEQAFVLLPAQEVAAGRVMEEAVEPPQSKRRKVARTQARGGRGRTSFSGSTSGGAAAHHRSKEGDGRNEQFVAKEHDEWPPLIGQRWAAAPPEVHPLNGGGHGDAGDRPTVLYDRPRRVEVSLMAPDGPVVVMRWGGRSCAVVKTVGPERVRIPWWQRRGARDPAGPMARDYFKLQDEAGQWWWVYRAYPSGQWFVHGVWG